MRNLSLFTILLISIANASSVYALGLRDCKLSPSEAEDSSFEHIYGGALNDENIHSRRAYVFTYNKDENVPAWTAWHVIKAYRDTPERKSRWATFRTDPELDKIKDKDYVGWYDSEYNFARGHIAPYYISGGDRDHDGMDAENETDLSVEDKDDACTVFEVNALSNIAPQYHDRFNGSPGLWWQLETDVRTMVDNAGEFYVFAGTIFLKDKDVQRIGDRKKSQSDWDIGVPHGYFKVVINPARVEAVAFLFDHAADLEKGCNIDTAKWPSNCITTIEDIETASGLRFFTKLTQSKNSRLRASSNKNTWSNWRHDYE